MCALFALLPTPYLCEVFDLTGPPFFFSRYINGNDEWETARFNSDFKYQERLGVRACGGLDTLSALLQSNAVASAAVKAHARTMGLLGSPDSSLKKTVAKSRICLLKNTRLKLQKD